MMRKKGRNVILQESSISHTDSEESQGQDHSMHKSKLNFKVPKLLNFKATEAYSTVNILN